MSSATPRKTRSTDLLISKELSCDADRREEISRSIRAINMQDLTDLVGGHLPSMRNAFYLNPQDFPPAINIPGCRGVRFLMADVLVWLDSLKAAKAPASRTEPPAHERDPDHRSATPGFGHHDAEYAPQHPHR